MPLLKIQKAVIACKDDILPLCRTLRRSAWLRLFPDVHPFVLRDISLSIPDEQQVWTDIRRCEHLNPALYRDERTKRHLHRLLMDFLATQLD